MVNTQFRLQNIARELTVHLFTMLGFLEIENELIKIIYINANGREIHMDEYEIQKYLQYNYPNYVIGKWEKIH